MGKIQIESNLLVCNHGCAIYTGDEKYCSAYWIHIVTLIDLAESRLWSVSHTLSGSQ